MTHNTDFTDSRIKRKCSLNLENRKMKKMRCVERVGGSK